MRPVHWPQLLCSLWFFLFISFSGMITFANEDDEAGESASESTNESANESISEVVQSVDAGHDDFEEVLLSQTQQQPTDSFGQTLVRTAGTFGANIESEVYSKSELDNGPAAGFNITRAADISHDSGYMKQGMDQHFGERIIANVNVGRLFQLFGHLRSEAAVRLPAEFASIVNFVEHYIEANALGGAAANNELSHRSLAIQVVRASFCFGNDPLMILAKMRRETNFSRKSVSPTGAVGFSQMTSMGIKEVQHQLSGNGGVSLPGAKGAFQQSIRCFSGINNYELPSENTQTLKNRIAQKWGFDMMFGQILLKTLVSYAKASGSYGSNAGGIIAAYEDAFTIYNGDTQATSGSCTKKASVQMREEYACDVISQFNRMSAQWNRYVVRSTGKDII